MCTGGEIAIIAVVVASSAASAGMQMSQAADQADYQEALAAREAQIAMNNAEEQARRSREEYAKIKGQQRAAFAKGGVTFQGTPAEMLARTAEDEELDSLTILHAGKMGYESAVISGRSARFEANQRMTATGVQFGTSLLTKGAGLYGMSTGAFGSTPGSGDVGTVVS